MKKNGGGEKEGKEREKNREGGNRKIEKNIEGEEEEERL